MYILFKFCICVVQLCCKSLLLLVWFYILFKRLFIKGKKCFEQVAEPRNPVK